MPVHLPSHTHLVQTTLPPVAAADATVTFPVLVAPANTPLLVSRISVTAYDAITGADTNTKHVNVLVGTEELSTLELVTGTNVAARTETALYAPAAPFTLAAGAVLSVQVEKVGNGQALPPLAVRVEWAPK